MKADEALAQNQGNPIYSVHHGQLLEMVQCDEHYTLNMIDLKDSATKATFISSSIYHALGKDTRYLAEWYLSEQAARNGKQPEEFFIYTIALYQHKESLEVISVKFCNGDVVGIIPDAVRRKTKHQHSLLTDTDLLRDFLFNPDKYQWLSSYWLATGTQSIRDKGYANEQAERKQKYLYVYHNLKDDKQYEQYTNTLRDAIRLAHAHVRGDKKKPLSIEGPHIGKLELHPQKLPNDKFRIPELEPFEAMR